MVFLKLADLGFRGPVRQQQSQRTRQHRHAFRVTLRPPVQPVQLPLTPRMQPLVPVHPTALAHLVKIRRLKNSLVVKRQALAHLMKIRRQPLVHPVTIRAIQLGLRQPFIKPQEASSLRSPISKSAHRLPSGSDITAVPTHESAACPAAGPAGKSSYHQKQSPTPAGRPSHRRCTLPSAAASPSILMEA